MATKHYLYYVEGEDDKKVVDTLKKDMKLIIPGIARVFNVVENSTNQFSTYHDKRKYNGDFSLRYRYWESR